MIIHHKMWYHETTKKAEQILYRFTFFSIIFLITSEFEPYTNLKEAVG